MNDDKRRSMRIPTEEVLFAIIQLNDRQMKMHITDRSARGIGIHAEGLFLHVGDKVFVEKIMIEGIETKQNAVNLFHGAKVTNMRPHDDGTESYGLEFLPLRENFSFLTALGKTPDMRRLDPLKVISQFLSIKMA